LELLSILFMCFLFGLLHGILPDEHTWPITFSYAIGGASGKQGMMAGLYFSGAFTIQRALLSMLSYFALGQFLASESVSAIVFVAVGLAMAIAGILVLRKNIHPHLHLFGHQHTSPMEMETGLDALHRHHHEDEDKAIAPASPAPHWAMLHGFIAGFGFEGIALYPTVVAAPKMPNFWAALLPGLLFGLGTMLILAILGAFFGASLRWIKNISKEKMQRIGALTSGRTLLYGGIFFMIFAAASLLGFMGHTGHEEGDYSHFYMIGIFMVAIALPSLYFSWKEVMKSSH